MEASAVAFALRVPSSGMLHVDLPDSDLLTEYSPCSFETFTLVISSLDFVRITTLSS